MSQPQIVLIGAGHLGSLILKAWIKNKNFPQNKIHVHVQSKKTLLELKKKYPKLGLSSVEDDKDIPSAGTYVVAVKPQQWASLRDKLKIKVKKKTLLISIMAGIPPSRLENETGAASIVAMTNTSIQVNEALTSLFKSNSCTAKNLKDAEALFSPFGMVAVLEESDFAAATAFGGSHPAFAIWIMSEISKIISAKLPSVDGTSWTLQVFKGAEKLMNKNKNSAELLKQIATPGGCTAEGLKALVDLNISGKLYEVFEACQKKAETLGK